MYICIICMYKYLHIYTHTHTPNSRVSQLVLLHVIPSAATQVLGEFNFRMKDEETALFLHRTEAPRKTELVVLRSAVVQLDALVNHRSLVAQWYPMAHVVVYH